jgi:Pyruvate/2-oxoacid:ferredoxin oxidoreductase gamma subunit
MGEAVYVDLEVLASIEDDDYLVRVSKKDLNALVTFDEYLVLRHWDGEKPVSLVAYGSDSVRTEGDANEENNLANLPELAGLTGIIAK